MRSLKWVLAALGVLGALYHSFFHSEASPGRGRNPCATVPRNAACWGWSESRKT